MIASYQQMSDGERVVQAAAHLGVTEFEVFRRAYHDRFTREAGARSLERDFARYMYFGSTPPWVCQFAQRCLAHTDGPLTTARRNPGMSRDLARLMSGTHGGPVAP